LESRENQFFIAKRYLLAYNRPAAKVRLTLCPGLDRNHKVIIGGGVTIADFELLRNEITKKIPSHKKGLTGKVLKEATAKAWTSS